MNNGTQLKWLNNEEVIFSGKSLEEEQIPGEVNWVALQISKRQVPLIFFLPFVIRLLSLVTVRCWCGSMGPSSGNTEARGWTRRGHPDFMIHLKMEENVHAELAEISHVQTGVVTDIPADPSLARGTGDLAQKMSISLPVELGFWSEERVDEWLLEPWNTVCQAPSALMVSELHIVVKLFRWSRITAESFRVALSEATCINWVRSYRWNLRNGSAHGGVVPACPGLAFCLWSWGWVHDWLAFLPGLPRPPLLFRWSKWSYKLSQKTHVDQHLGAGVFHLGSQEPDFQGQGLWLTPLCCFSFTPWPFSLICLI